mmetsp:Transcript_21748/g.29164  ORF Transcript_21748/g.29164 Transcript_21748/m.29164 type:complete len:103 (-) Transcript_21748:1866-2174(-)
MSSTIETFSRDNVCLRKDTPSDAKESLELLEAFLKQSGSVQMLFIPATDSYLDKKGYSWRLRRADGGGLEFDFTFEHPDYISTDGVDKINITIRNAHCFLQP